VVLPLFNATYSPAAVVWMISRSVLALQSMHKYSIEIYHQPACALSGFNLACQVDIGEAHLGDMGFGICNFVLVVDRQHLGDYIPCHMLRFPYR
jgi:hypothetical protein